MAKHAADKRTAPEQSAPSVEQPLAGGMAPAFSLEENDEKRKRKGLKVFGITMGVLVALLVAAYAAGVVVFSGRFFPNTYVADVDISLKTPEEVHAVLDDLVGDYSFRVVGQGLDMTFTSQEAGMTLDSAEIAESMMADVNAWAWPVEVFSAHDETESLVASYGSTALADAVNAEVAKVNEGAVLPADATIAFDAEKGAFAVVPEVAGTALDAEKVIEAITEGAMQFEPKITLTPEVLLQPTVLKDDPRLAAAVEEANGMVKADLDLYMDGNLVAEVTPALISSWVTVSPEITVVFNDEAFTAWIDQMNAQCDTVGSERSYTRADGKAITVSGGSYGWEIDSEALRTLVTDAVHAGTVGDIDIPVLQSGNGFSELGSRDWGARYCDIDLSEQYARFYDDSGACVWETAVVTGKPDGSHDTPPGVWYITWGMESPSLLIGTKDPKTGKPEYETKVSYWMPFVGNSIGLHDATWQSAFGGSRYAQGYGSHGCVNISLDAAGALYDIIEKGDVVVVHW
ncbi:L,D-transpeptidase family protein [Adlercreutzia sp. ZJ242]|uniref:L,D-transpeptidase family protein n=1 Tax=Adlercreutzia sp. ZJ242 TaxID=2709409 RepID=UPI001F1506B1|nr:L,D-transpeptidase family protein [Adlercreutzia sp. ZJ242]